MYSTYNEEKSVVTKRCIRTLRNKIYKQMTTVSKNVYFDDLNDIVDKYNNTYHRTIKMKPVNVKSDSYAKYNVDSNDRDPKFTIGNHARVSKYKHICSKGYPSNWSEEVFVILKKKPVPWTYVSSDLNGEKIVGIFYKKEFQKKIKMNLEYKRQLKEKMYVKWKGYVNSCNSWIDKKDIT